METSTKERPAAEHETETEEVLVYQLGYASAATRPFSEEELEDLLAKARAKNARLGITGMLLYDDGTFFQVLEGERNAVEHLYAVISADERATNSVLLFRHEEVPRHFTEWKMGFHHAKGSFAGPPGYSHFLQTGAVSDLSAEESEQIRQVLLGFRDGRWHRHVDF